MLLPKAYTLAEANALVPFLEDSFAQIHAQATRAHQARAALVRAAVERQQREEEAPLVAASELDPAAARVLAEADERIRAELLLLQRMGVLVKSLDPPTVDVFAKRGPSLVHLCWQRGEPEFGYWHDVHTGIAGREPIDNPALFGEDELVH